ncbi:hypothetical protein C9374_005674 [Naegleria lovaniensis]|uniref:BRCT domain-containing protein n=1 Tax=Naegleria lovaniensis TaxID=51637 RepID=A0AA88GP33_NAELO|nr:uncharacterized protein C9374_005674 [Naegleria lovaniensis]KAG2381882.1 hypothetical protein C9374_005674 [Naegleria lovaniensis]
MDRKIRQVCFTAFNSERKVELAEKATKLGLIVEFNFETRTDVLVVARVGTDKYRQAIANDVPVVKEEWLLESMKEGKLLDVSKFIAPALYGCKICATGFKEEMRNRIKRMCELNGAIYNPALMAGYTHLIAKKKGSEKFEFALQNDINIVTSKWIEDSVKLEYAQDESHYFLPSLTDDEKEKCKEILAKFQSKSALSEGDITTPTSTTSTKPFPTSVQPTQVNKNDSLDTADFSASQFSTEDADMSLLNGLVFYLIGFTHSITEVRKTIRNYGGIASFSLLPTINYIIVDETMDTKDMLRSVMEKLSYEPPVVPSKWLRDSIKNMEIQPIDLYKTNFHNDNKTDNNHNVDVTSATTTKASPITTQTDFIELDISEEDLAEALKSQTRASQLENKHQDTEISNIPPMANELKNSVKTFSNYSLQLSDLLSSTDKQQAKIIIERNGGKIVKTSPDFIIYPQSSKAARDNNPKIRTLTWLKDCENSNSVKNVKDSILYTPTFRLGFNKIPSKEEGVATMKNEDVVVVISGYPEDKPLLSTIVELLGAKTSGALRKTSTILVCEDTSDKYIFAVKNNIPIVTKYWLMESYKAGYFLPPSDFKQVISENKETSTSTLTTSTSTTVNTVDATTATNINTAPPTSVDTPTPSKSEQKEVCKTETTPTKMEILTDENARDTISPSKPPTVATPVNITSLSNVKSKVLDLLPKKKSNVTNKTADIFSEPSSDTTFVAKKNLESNIFISNDPMDSNSGSVNSVSDFGAEYDQKLKKEKLSKLAHFNTPAYATQLETQIICHDSESHKDLWKSSYDQKVFLLTSVSDKATVAACIERLGGKVEDTYSSSITHLIMGSPSTTEKFFCCVASGCWILRPEYISASYKQKQWLEEEPYQYNDGKLDAEVALHLSTARRIRETKQRPFANLCVYLADESPSYANIILAGGGKILTNVDNLEQDLCTHIFYTTPESKKLKKLRKMYPNIPCAETSIISSLLSPTSEGKRRVEPSAPETAPEQPGTKKRKFVKK